MMRDPISASLAMQYSGRRESSAGCDAAYLLTDFDGFSPELEHTNDSNDGLRIGYSFGRIVRRSPENAPALRNFVERVADKAGASDIVNINWLSGSPNLISRLRKKLDQIRTCDLIITDTYHCAVNSWREGTPAICIGKGLQGASNSLSDKKKEIMYHDFGMSDYYVYFEDIHEEVERKISKLIDNFRNEKKNNAIRSNIKFRADEMRYHLRRGTIV